MPSRWSISVARITDSVCISRHARPSRDFWLPRPRIQQFSLLGHEYAVSGDVAKAMVILTKLQEISAKKYVPAVYFAVIYTGLNRKDDAFQWLDKAFAERCEYLVSLRTEPLADPLRSDPRFSRLLARLGLEPASLSTAVKSVIP